MKFNAYILFTLTLFLLFSKAANCKVIDNSSNVLSLNHSKNKIAASKNLTVKDFQVKNDFCAEDSDQDIDDPFFIPFLSFYYYYPLKSNHVTPNLKKVITRAAHSYHVRLFILFNSLIIPWFF